MKKKTIIFAAALCVALSACGGQNVQESAPATAVPTATVPAAQTASPTAVPTPVVVTMEPDAIHTEEPTVSPAPTPVLTSMPTAAPSVRVSVSPSVEPTAPAAPTPAPEVTPPPAESEAQVPAPTESLCGLPLAPTPTPEGSVPPAASESPAPMESQAPARPTDEEVLAAYNRAAEVFSWYAGYSDDGLALDGTDMISLPLLENGGEIVMFRVTRPGLNSMDELRAYLKTIFSDEVVDGLMKDFPLGAAGFADGPEGGLYCSGAGRGSDISKGGVTIEAVWPLEEEPIQCTVRVSVELLDLNDLQTVTGTQVYEFPYQKVGEKWVFTSFESIF